MECELEWPSEWADARADSLHWSGGWHNRLLDFHGDPIAAGVCLASDGNHHMALQACLRRFVADHPEVKDVFYLTLPPQRLLPLLRGQTLRVGNVSMSRVPDVLIGPADWVAQQAQQRPQHIFAQSRGQAWLVRRGNPGAFTGLDDLLSGRHRLFISHPRNEKASYTIYRETLLQQCISPAQQCALDELLIDPDRVCQGQQVHHREAPVALAQGRADVALLYYHLALRYTRLFPDRFDLILADGFAATHPITRYAICNWQPENPWADRLAHFFCSAYVGQCYDDHGLQAISG